MPILTMSAPARISASVMSPVTTLPAMITDCGFSSRTRLDDVEELLCVAVGDVEADEARLRALAHCGELGEVGLGRAERVEGVNAVFAGEELRQLVLGIVFVQRRQRAALAERARHRHRAGDVHVGGDEREAAPFAAGMEEAERAVDVDRVAGAEGRALGSDQNVLEVELDVAFDAHGIVRNGARRRAASGVRRALARTGRGGQAQPPAGSRRPLRRANETATRRAGRRPAVEFSAAGARRHALASDKKRRDSNGLQLRRGSRGATDGGRWRRPSKRPKAEQSSGRLQTKITSQV